MSILILAEHDHQTLKPSTLSCVTAAQKIGGEIHVIVTGHDAKGAADAATKITGVSKVFWVDHAGLKQQLAENVSAALLSIAKNYTHILAPATTSGKNIMPRVAALLDVQMISDISSVLSADSFIRPIYAGNAFATVQSSDAIKVLTVRTTTFDKAKADGGSAVLESLPVADITAKTAFIKQELTKSERPELTAARFVVSGGRGMGSGENFKIIETLADKIGAAVGASRAAVDAGFVPNDYQVGQTGKVVAPELYVAVGISGAIQHLAGMKDSKIIVAINKDGEAPIFQVADYGIVADLFEAVPALEKAL
jgi:electron transfer flavoprotein alpha subunit